jgi:DNA-binding PucR family transcriptional regulator
VFSKRGVRAGDVLRALARGADSDSADTCRRLLLPLERADADRNSRLGDTLRTYYVCGGSVSKTAEALFLHRNSVRYRLDRVRALLGADIDHPEIAAVLLAAFAVSAAHQVTEARDEAQRAQ